ncbi:MAG: chemotaxis protein CheW, partial [Butyrivibrio sp.]
NLRGEIIPVMSLRRKFGLEDDVYTNNTRIIIIKLEQQGMVGLLVDSVKEVVNLEESDIEKTNLSLTDGGQAYISAVGKLGGNLISLLNLQAVIIDKETV